MWSAHRNHRGLPFGLFSHFFSVDAKAAQARFSPIFLGPFWESRPFLVRFWSVFGRFGVLFRVKDRITGLEVGLGLRLYDDTIRKCFLLIAPRAMRYIERPEQRAERQQVSQNRSWALFSDVRACNLGST